MTVRHFASFSPHGRSCLVSMLRTGNRIIGTRRSLLLLAVTGVGLGAAGPVQAAEVTEQTRCDRYQNCVSGLRYAADPGERNDIRIRSRGTTIEFLDPGAVIRAPLARCEGSGSSRVACLISVDGVEVLAGDQADRVELSPVDRVQATIVGGSGDDRLVGGPQDDRFVAGAGNDEILGGAGRHDQVSYADDRRRWRIDLNAGHASAAGERDRLSGIEDARGGRAGDVLLGDGEANELVGGGGYDVLRGRAGDDRLHGGRELDGGDGDDHLDFTTGRGHARCGAGTDSVDPIGPRTALADDCEQVELFPFSVTINVGHRDPARDLLTISDDTGSAGDLASARVTTLGGRVLARGVRRVRCESASRCSGVRLRLRFSRAGAALVRRARPLTVVLHTLLERRTPVIRDGRYYGAAVRIRLSRP